MSNNLLSIRDIEHAIVDDRGHLIGIMGKNRLPSYFPRVLAQSAVPVTLTGTTAETVLASILVPSGLMGPNGALRVTPLWSCTNSANGKTFKVQLGGTAFFNAGATTINVIQPLVVIRNRSANSQVAFPAAGNSGTGTAGAVVNTAAVNTSLDQLLTITGQLANVGETITLEGYTVEVLFF